MEDSGIVRGRRCLVEPWGKSDEGRGWGGGGRSRSWGTTSDGGRGVPGVLGRWSVGTARDWGIVKVIPGTRGTQSLRGPGTSEGGLGRDGGWSRRTQGETTTDRGE